MGRTGTNLSRDGISQLRRGIGLPGLTFLLAFLVAALTGLSYAEHATTFPQAGGEFEFVRRAFGSNRAAFLVVASGISFVGIQEWTAVNVAFTLIEMGGLVAVIGVASSTQGVLAPSLPIKN